jgi:hypothetical protein
MNYYFAVNFFCLNDDDRRSLFLLSETPNFNLRFHLVLNSKDFIQILPRKLTADLIFLKVNSLQLRELFSVLSQCFQSCIRYFILSKVN